MQEACCFFVFAYLKFALGENLFANFFEGSALLFAKGFFKILFLRHDALRDIQEDRVRLKHLVEIRLAPLPSFYCFVCCGFISPESESENEGASVSA